MTELKNIDPNPRFLQTAVTGSAFVYRMLNLYACLGGNRYKWDDVAKEANIQIEVTAVEFGLLTT